MRPNRLVLGAMLAVALSAARIVAQDHPAALVVYPYVVTDTMGLDTTVQLTNASSTSVEARCFYEDLTPDCVNGTAGESCAPRPVTCSGFCAPRYERRPFRVRLTPRQPLTWRVSDGLLNGPLDGEERAGPQGESNQFTDVPPFPSPMVGTLRCVVVGLDPSRAAAENALVGLATVEQRRTRSTRPTDEEAMQYRAIGFRALTDGRGPDDDEFLQLGGLGAEYESCPAVVTLEHFFDGAPLRTGDETATVQTSVVLASCAAGYTLPGAAVAQFFVYNEFGQRFSTSRAVAGQLISRLALIDTAQPQRSIFSVGVAGTLAGQTLIQGIGSSLHALGSDLHTYAADRVRSDAFNVHGAGERAAGDVIVFRPALCTGDCNFDGSVRVNELVSGVNIALSQTDLERCVPMDANRNFQIAVNELVSATNAAIDGCPEPPVITPPPTPSPTPSAPPVSSLGPEITHFGLATADDRPLEPDMTDDEGRPVFVRPFGQGMTILVEARRGTSNRPVGRTTYTLNGLPDLQLLVSNALGNGDPTVCEDDGRSGGVPASPELDFAASGAAAVINDLGCRAFDRMPDSESVCTRSAFSEGGRLWRAVNPASTIQYCVPVARAWAFPAGDTIVAGRVRDVSGNLSEVSEIVVRVSSPE